MNIEYNMRGVLHAFFRQKWKFILVLALFAAAGAYYVNNAKPQYEARGSFLVKFGKGAKPEINMPGLEQPAPTSQGTRSEIMQSHIRILMSRDLLEKVVLSLGVKNIYPSTVASADSEDEAIQKAIDSMVGGDLEVKPSGESNLIEIYVHNENPEMAERIVSRLMDMFVVRQAEIYDTEQTSFLDKQIEQMKYKLEESRNKLLSFKETAGISAIDEEMSQLLREKTDLSGLAFQSVSEARDGLDILKAKQAEMRATYKADSPVMKRLQDSIAVAEKQLSDRQSDLNNNSGAAVTDKDGSLAQKIAAIDKRIAWLEAQRGTFNELDQRVRMDEENFQYYRQRGEEARVNNLLNRENITRISIVDRPVVPAKPIGPRKKLILIAFLLAGMVMGLGLSLTLEILDDSVASPEQLTASLGLPVLASFRKVRGA